MKKIVCVILAVLTAVLMLSTAAVASDGNVLLGDVNSDGVIDMKDAYLLKKRVAHLISNNEINKVNSDIYLDNKIDEMDILYLQRHLSNQKQLANSTVYTMDYLSDCMNLVGRAVLSGTDILLSQTASGFKFTANCEGDIIIGLTTEKSGYLDIVVDNDYDNYKRITVDNRKAKYQVELGLEKGEHTILIQKATEWSHNNLYTINTISIDGEKGSSKPAEKPLKFEFYGDSITSGYGNLCSKYDSNGGSWQYQDGTQTYAAYVSNILGAEYAVGSASGHGVLGGHSDFTSSYKKFFDYSTVSSNASNNIAWSRKDYNADLIVINYGANDATRVTKQMNGTMQPAFDAEKFKSDFEAECSLIIDKMHEENPNAKILWISGMNYIANTNPVIVSLGNVAEKYDFVEFYHSPSTSQNGGDYHPDINDHKNAADDLAQKIKTLYPDLISENK